MWCGVGRAIRRSFGLISEVGKEREEGVDVLAQTLEEVGQVCELYHEPRTEFVDEIVGPVFVSFFDN